MGSAYDVLRERGFIEQTTDAGLISDLLGRNKITCYIGFDPTAASLHVGSLVPIMALIHLQRHGHRPLVLVGGGTGLIGDPSGKTEMRQVLTEEQVAFNARALQEQLSRYLDFHGGRALLLNNADWLTKLNYLEFLRDIGRHFSVNKMLSAESYRIRMEKGLNLIEFNYMLLQAYDYLHLFQHQHCVLQMGGNDQWGNILAGIDLIRRVEGTLVHGMTFPLLVTAHGHKMGKTERGALWLDGALTAPYDYYQYWINTDDADLQKFMALFTFLPMEEIRQAGLLADSELNMAKSVLAFEATRITHGQEAAVAAFERSAQLFGIKPLNPDLFPSSTIPRPDITGEIQGGPPALSLAASGTVCLPIERSRLLAGVPAFELFHETNLCASRGEARRIISQGGGYVNDRQITAFDEKIGIDDVDAQGEIRLRKGKKKYFIIRVK